MTAVIAFPLERCRSANEGPVRRSADVMIFTGVRVERLEPQRTEQLAVPLKRPAIQLQLLEVCGET